MNEDKSINKFIDNSDTAEFQDGPKVKHPKMQTPTPPKPKQTDKEEN